MKTKNVICLNYSGLKTKKRVKEGWIEIKPVLSRFEENPISVMESRQKCGSIARDEESGYIKNLLLKRKL